MKGEQELSPAGFGDQAALGRNAAWRVGLALLLIVGGSLVAVRLLAEAYERLGLEAALLRLAEARGPTSLRIELFAFAFLMFSVIVMLPLMRLVLPWLHRRPWRSFLTAKPRFDWMLFALSASAMLLLALLSLGLTLLLSPQELRFSPNWGEVAAFTPLALLTLPLQCLTEEIFFRGYIFQLIGRLTRLVAVRLLVPALLFTAAHSANPEAQYDFLWASADYLMLALYLGAISIKANGLEASLGAHLAINVNGAVLVGSTVSVSPGPTLWLSGAPDFRALAVATLVLIALHYGLVFVLAPKFFTKAKE
jgi:membrane protease YdiL (CAAX protease family)